MSVTPVPTTTIGEMRAAAEYIHAEARGFLQTAIIRRIEFPALAEAAVAGSPLTMRAAQLVMALLHRIGTERTPKPTLCGTCPRQLRRAVGAVCVAIPMVDEPASGLAVGLCPRCSATAEAAHANGVAALRKLWPDLEDKGLLHPTAGRA